jgi:hypothetical protein
MLTASGSVTSRLNGFFNAGCVTVANPSLPLSSANAAAWPIIGQDGKATGFGNAPIGLIRGPAQGDWDISLGKRFPVAPINDRANAEFRAEFFNAFNNPNFGGPDSNVSDSTFGRITATTVAPRIIQFALKLNF